MTGKDFERIIIYRMASEPCHMSRYGVQASVKGFINGKPEVVVNKSLPDFEGILKGGRQFIFDAKVCSQASFPLVDKKLDRQLRHMFDRDAYGAICFLLIHFSARKLKTRTDEELTVAFPVSRRHMFWGLHERSEVKAITRADARCYGVQVAWNKRPGERVERPDVMAAIDQLELSEVTHA